MGHLRFYETFHNVEEGTDRDKKGLSLLVSEKSRDKTRTKPEKIEQGPNRDKPAEKKEGQFKQGLNRNNQE